MALPIYSNTMRIATWRIQHSFHLVIALLFIASSVVTTQDPDFEIVPNSALCSTVKTCDECMVIHPSCAWCMEPEFDKNDNYDRCDTMENLRLRGCAQEEIETAPSLKEIKQNDPLSENTVHSENENIVQVAPQKVTIRTRPGQPVPLPQMTIRQAEDFPVDLYYIMDLSQSMADDLDNLKDLGDKLALVMGNITTNFRLGYGAFVDKLVMPYANIMPQSLINPCLGGVYCDPPFGFKNVLPLTEETGEFANAIGRVNASGNLDSPEGGLDALMQATVCTEQIGWRDHARHLLLYSTDAPFHIAGDGLLGGIVTRNDGLCHTEKRKNGVYTKATELDYPSISQLSVLMKKHSILPIFAIGRADKSVPIGDPSDPFRFYKDYPSISQLSVIMKKHSILPIFAIGRADPSVLPGDPSDPFRFYKDLPNFFHESHVARLSTDSDNIVEVVKNVYLNLPAFFHESQVVRLSSDSSDIVQVVRDVYLKSASCDREYTCESHSWLEPPPIHGQNITASVKVEDNAPANAFTLNYTATCLDGVPMPGVQECSGLQLGDDVFFNITLTMNETVCASQKRTHVFNIGPTAFNEFMEVTVEAICECACSEIENEDDKVCNGSGIEVCGGCQCFDGWSGARCDCNKQETGLVDAGCIWNVTGDNPADNPIECNNRGVCNCGVCSCSNLDGKKYYGSHCQCDDFSCPRHLGLVCGGNRGLCMCNETTGTNFCNCTSGFTGDRCECPVSQEGCRSPDGSICNNNAGVCVCGKCECNDTSKYRGPTCFECADCPGECEEHRPCVQCVAFNSGELTEEECDECPYPIHVVEELTRSSVAKECVFKDDDDCLFVFTHERLPNGTYYIEVKEEKVCPDQSAILWMIIGIIVGILLVGLVLLLIWRLLTYIHDRREFNQFEKERENARWEAGQNPIYKPSTSVFKNPTYGKS